MNQEETSITIEETKENNASVKCTIVLIMDTLRESNNYYENHRFRNDQRYQRQDYR